MSKKLKRKLEKFKQQSKSEKIADIFMLCLVLVGFIVGVILTFCNTDLTPASQKDFEPLYTQKELLENDFSSVYGMNNAKITISDDSNVVNLDSEECKLILTFDKDFNLISTEEVDHSDSIGFTIFISIIMGIASTFIFFVIFIVFLLAYLIILAVCETISKKIFKKNETNDSQNSDSQEE